MKLFLCFMLLTPIFGGVYHPEADAKKEISAAVEKAKKEGKHVLIQVGGNWCSWCMKMEKLLSSDPEMKAELEANYVYIFVNYSKENKNLEVLKELGFPQRFGFPVLVVLDGKGHRLHTQNTGLLEEDGGYSKEKILNFFKHWSPSALDPAKY